MKTRKKDKPDLFIPILVALALMYWGLFKVEPKTTDVLEMILLVVALGMYELRKQNQDNTAHQSELLESIHAELERQNGTREEEVQFWLYTGNEAGIPFSTLEDAKQYVRREYSQSGVYAVDRTGGKVWSRDAHGNEWAPYLHFDEP